MRRSCNLVAMHGRDDWTAASQGRLAGQQLRCSHSEYRRPYGSRDDSEMHVCICRIYYSPSAPFFISSNSFLKPSLTTTEMP